MSRSRVAALAAVIVVPVVILAIVLASLIDSDGSKDGSTVATKPVGGATGAGARGATGPASPAAPSPAQSQAGRSTVPDTALQVLDEGAVPKQLSDKIGPAASNGTIALGELRGSPIVLNVWSAKCTPCRAETRVLESEWERLGSRGVLFLGLNVLDSGDSARRFRAENGMTYPSVEEKRASTARAMGATGVPETFFISKDGNIVGRVAGAISLAQLEFGIRAAEKGQPMPAAEGGGQVPLR